MEAPIFHPKYTRWVKKGFPAIVWCLCHFLSCYLLLTKGGWVWRNAITTTKIQWIESMCLSSDSTVTQQYCSFLEKKRNYWSSSSFLPPNYWTWILLIAFIWCLANFLVWDHGETAEPCRFGKKTWVWIFSAPLLTG